MEDSACYHCFRIYSTADLAKECKEQEAPAPEISLGTLVKFNDAETLYYGFIKEHYIHQNEEDTDTVRGEVKQHELACQVEILFSEVTNNHGISTYFPYFLPMEGILEKNCTALQENEIKAVEAVTSKMGYDPTGALPSIEILCQQNDPSKMLSKGTLIIAD